MHLETISRVINSYKPSLHLEALLYLGIVYKLLYLIFLFCLL